MGSFSIWHWLLVAVVVLLLFGRGRISDVQAPTFGQQGFETLAPF